MLYDVRVFLDRLNKSVIPLPMKLNHSVRLKLNSFHIILKLEIWTVIFWRMSNY